MSESPPSGDKHTSSKETIATGYRVKELLETPLTGAHDLERLQKTHAYIFQDIKPEELGQVLSGYKAGDLRDPTPYNKIRTLETQPGEFYVAYSKRDETAMKRLNTALADCQPRDLKGLPVSEATGKIAKLYAELDYVHPFGDGNSRTLRSFTRQLARDSGFDVKWEKLAETPIDRDRLRIARDKEVLEKVIPELEGSHRAWRSAVMTLGRYEPNKGLEETLKVAVRSYVKTEEKKIEQPDPMQKVKEAMIAKGWPAQKADEAIAQMKAKAAQPSITKTAPEPTQAKNKAPER